MYKVKFYHGDYRERQHLANVDGAICYLEQHLNSSINEHVNYSACIVATNASEKSMDWASDLASRTSGYLQTPIYEGAFGRGVMKAIERGNGNLFYTDMPAIINEPLFASNPLGARMLKEGNAIAVIARQIATSIEKNFPEGGLVAFSIGHKGQRSKPNDRGAQVYGGGTEAEFSELILKLASRILTNTLHTEDEGEKPTSNNQGNIALTVLEDALADINDIISELQLTANYIERRIKRLKDEQNQ